MSLIDIERWKNRALATQEIALCVVRKWWRPAICVGLVGSVWVNLVIIPYQKGQPIEFASASAFVGSIVAAFGVRAFEKWKGLA